MLPLTPLDHEFSSSPLSNTSENSLLEPNDLDIASAIDATPTVLNAQVNEPLPLVPGDASWGIDTVRISYGIQPEHCDPSHELWTGTSTYIGNADASGETWRGSRKYDQGEVRVFVYLGRGTCSLEFNAARLIDSNPLYLLPPDMLMPLVEKMVWDLHEVVWPSFLIVTGDGEITLQPNWASSVRITRLDLARDLHIESPGPVKAALEAMETRYGRRKSVETSRSGGWTVYNKTRSSGLDRCYDKAAESRHKDPDAALKYVPEGTFRFETELKGDRLKSSGLSRLDRIHEQSSWDAMAHRWEQTRWGSLISTGTGLEEVLARLTPHLRTKVLAYLASESLGNILNLDPRVANDLARRCRDLGLTPGLPLESLGGAARCIDLFSGRLMDA